MSRIRMSHLLAGTIALALGAAPAQAQFGGLLKKAKQAAEKKVEQQANTATDPKAESLSEESLIALMRGLEAERPKAERAQRMWRRADSLEQGSKALMESHKVEFSSYESKRSAIEDCRSSTFSSLEDDHADELEKKTNDPKFAAKIQAAMMQHSAAHAKAMQSGDTVQMANAIEAMNARMFSAIGMDFHADSVTVTKKCGEVPVEPAWVRQSKRMERDGNEARTQSRLAEADVISTGAVASGMNIEKYGQARERVLSWFRETNGGNDAKKSESPEEKMFRAHKAELQKYRASLGEQAVNQ